MRPTTTKKLSWNISQLYLCSMQLLCNPLLCSLLYFLTNLSYSTLLSDSTMLIFFNLKYITPLTNNEKATVRRKAYRKLGGSIFRPNITESISNNKAVQNFSDQQSRQCPNQGQQDILSVNIRRNFLVIKSKYL